MKIGILTYHRTLNYGACLQAVATRVVLENMGHEVYYVDYWPKYHKDTYSLFNWTKLKRDNWGQRVKDIASYIRDWKGAKKRINAFQTFLNEYIIPYCKPYNQDEDYDVVIYGSDQIWRKQLGLNNHINWVYFGENSLNSHKQISYAASMGDINLNEEELVKIKECLSKFEHIGVREENIYSILKSLHLPNVEMTLDPTFLLTSDQWDAIIHTKRLIKEPYALIYQLKPAFTTEEIINDCKRRGLKPVFIQSRFNYKNAKEDWNTVTPNQFVSLIKHADFCYVASFHGLAFSIIYNKQFFASFRKASNRAETLLKNIGLTSRLVTPMASLPLHDEAIDYQIVQPQIDKLRGLSTQFLKSI